MNADQVIEGVGKAAASANTQEFCLLTIDHWLTCMNKTEWAAWSQVAAVTVTLCIPFFQSYRKRHQARLVIRKSADDIAFNVKKLREIAKAAAFAEEKDSSNVLRDVVAQFAYLRELQPVQVEAFALVSPVMLAQILNVIGAIKARGEILRQLAGRQDLVLRGHLRLHLKEQAAKIRDECKDLEPIEQWARAVR